LNSPPPLLVRRSTAQSFSRILVRALAITGIVTALVFAMPDLIILGLFLLVIPGLILIITPSVFLYLALFSAGWFPTDRFPTVLRVLAGLAAMFAVGVTLPLVSNGTDRYLAKARAQEVAPDSHVAPIHSIGIKPPSGRDECGDLCQTLLFNGSVQRVVSLPDAHSFVVEKRDTCPDAGKWLSGNSLLKDNNQIAKSSRLRIASGDCLIEQSPPSPPADFEFREVRESVGAADRKLSNISGDIRVEALELLRGGKVIARVSRRESHKLRIPLFLETQGGGEMHFSGWMWARSTSVEGGNENKNQLGAATFLERFTGLNLDPPKGLDAAVMRKNIDRALDDPLAPASDGAFALLTDFYDDVRGDWRKPNRNISSPDLRRIARLIDDPRATNFEGLSAVQLEPSAALFLLNPLLDRLKQLAEGQQWEPYRQLSQLLKQMPPGAMKKPDPRVEALIATAELRDHSIILVSRLADRGPAIAPQLVAFVEEGYTLRSGHRIGVEGARAALRALCKLGPQSKDALPRLRVAAAQGSIPPGAQEDDLWRATLVSLSASPEEFALPKNRIWRQDLYHNSLRRMAESGCEKN
jgi:hypothetical protein